ncbi:hypothetical protein ACFX11_000574 [Malus domestica]
MEEAHSGVCGAHQSGPKLHFELKRMGYYWPNMSSASEAYILAATDYFSKWAEAIPLREKVIGRTKRDWHERISEALWAYRTTHRTLTQATPYSLVYGVEAVLPLES